MAVDAVDTGATHGAPEALGDLARVTLVTGFLEGAVGWEQQCACVVFQFTVMSVHDLGHHWITKLLTRRTRAGKIQCRGIVTAGAQHRLFIQ